MDVEGYFQRLRKGSRTFCEVHRKRWRIREEAIPVVTDYFHPRPTSTPWVFVVVVCCLFVFFPERSSRSSARCNGQRRVGNHSRIKKP